MRANIIAIEFGVKSPTKETIDPSIMRFSLVGLFGYLFFELVDYK